MTEEINRALGGGKREGASEQKYKNNYVIRSMFNWKKLSKKYYVDTIIASYLTLLLIIYISSRSYSDALLVLIDRHYALYLVSIPIFSIILLEYLLDRTYIEQAIKKDSTVMLIGALTIITLVLTLFNPTGFEQVVSSSEDIEIVSTPYDLLDQKQIYYSMIYLTVTSLFSYLSKHERVKAIFAISSLLLIFSIIVEMINFKESITVVVNKNFLTVNWDIVGSDWKANLARVLKFLLPISLIYGIYSFIGKKKL